MGEIKIKVTVEGESEVRDALDRALELRVHKQPGACEKCVANENPHKIPMHPNCRCTVVFAN